MDWFLYDRDLHNERVKEILSLKLKIAFFFFDQKYFVLCLLGSYYWHAVPYRYGGARQGMHRKSSLQLIIFTGGTDISKIYHSAYQKIVKKF